MSQWFRCLAEAPRIGYRSHPFIQRSSLPGHNIVPDSSSREDRSWLLWPTADGSTSFSPAKSWQTQPQPGETQAQICIRQLYESLELPGVIVDYHFALAGCCDELWKLRQQDGWIVSEIEKLCWLDIRLVQAYPQIVVYPHDSQDFLRISVFGLLLNLYEREGYLQEALMVAKIAVDFRQGADALQRIQSRLANLEAEENG